MHIASENIISFDYNHEMDLLDLINRERLSQGMEELEWNDDLARACRYHAYDQGSQNYFDHNSMDRKDGKLNKVGDTFDRIRKFYSESHVNAENIAAGGMTPEEAYHDWFTSKGHYETMFNTSSKKVGIGVAHVPGSKYGYYWVLCTAE